MRVAIWNDFLALDVEELLRPRTEADVVAIIRRALEERKHVRAIGGRHSFNDIALCEDFVVDIGHLNRVLEVDRDSGLVRVQAGIRLADLVRALEAEGLALANVGAWTEQTLAGVIATATHGSSGRYRKTLVDSVEMLRLVDGRGEVRELRGDDLCDLTLGCFGIVTEADHSL